MNSQIIPKSLAISATDPPTSNLIKLLTSQHHLYHWIVSVTWCMRYTEIKIINWSTMDHRACIKLPRKSCDTAREALTTLLMQLPRDKEWQVYPLDTTLGAPCTHHRHKGIQQIHIYLYCMSYLPFTWKVAHSVVIQQEKHWLPCSCSYHATKNGKSTH